MSEAELLAYYEREGGREALREMPARIARARTWGTSFLDRQSAADVCEGNRAGPGETSLSLDGLWDAYCEPVAVSQSGPDAADRAVADPRRGRIRPQGGRADEMSEHDNRTAGYIQMVSGPVPVTQRCLDAYDGPCGRALWWREFPTGDGGSIGDLSTRTGERMPPEATAEDALV